MDDAERWAGKNDGGGEGQGDGRDEGRAEDREEGREDGREEGREDGREEGREDGREEGREDGRTLFLHQSAYVAKVQQRYFKGAPPKKQPITPLSSASFAKQDAGQFANLALQ
ncbi:unnamed protein product [Closterium sp. Naga37s-1]|nr:unnamed protein product [Closterium sp. Naga37s-1]